MLLEKIKRPLFIITNLLLGGYVLTSCSVTEGYYANTGFHGTKIELFLNKDSSFTYIVKEYKSNADTVIGFWKNKNDTILLDNIKPKISNYYYDDFKFYEYNIDTIKGMDIKIVLEEWRPLIIVDTIIINNKVGNNNLFINLKTRKKDIFLEDFPISFFYKIKHNKTNYIKIIFPKMKQTKIDNALLDIKNNLFIKKRNSICLKHRALRNDSICFFYLKLKTPPN